MDPTGNQRGGVSAWRNLVHRIGAACVAGIARRSCRNASLARRCARPSSTPHAAAVPLAGVAGLVLVDTRNAWPVLSLCGAGLLGLGVAVALMRHIQRDIADLMPAISPSDPRVDSSFASRA